jgi:hypothetical protein
MLQEFAKDSHEDRIPSLRVKERVFHLEALSSIGMTHSSEDVAPWNNGQLRLSPAESN